MRKIYYFNITYGCNSNCVFCYSHNTRHNNETFNEISLAQMKKYLFEKKVSCNDRVIINGGEPFLHSEIREILIYLKSLGCEILVYSNGRLISNFDLSFLNAKFRFVIPIHGFEGIHDSITGISGSYRETIKGLKYLVNNTQCLVDIKFILNNYIVEQDKLGMKTLHAFSTEIYFNNAIHLTKMADTIISRKNNCKPVSNDDAARFMVIFYKFFSRKKITMKIFDSCIKEMIWLSECEMDVYEDEIEVYFKDKNQYRKIDLKHEKKECEKECLLADKCFSAVDEYKTLEIYDNKVCENLE